MKNVFFTIILALFLTGCASTPPPSIQPVGDLSPVNPPNVNLSELKVK